MYNTKTCSFCNQPNKDLKPVGYVSVTLNKKLEIVKSESIDCSPCPDCFKKYVMLADGEL